MYEFIWSGLLFSFVNQICRIVGDKVVVRLISRCSSPDNYREFNQLKSDILVMNSSFLEASLKNSFK
jgi:hypothetical protein